MEYTTTVTIVFYLNIVSGVFLGSNDLTYWRCRYVQSFSCPNNDVTFYLYTRLLFFWQSKPMCNNTWTNLIAMSGVLCFIVYSDRRRRVKVDVRNIWSLYLNGWNPRKMNVIVVHGFNGAESNRVMVILRNGNIYFGKYVNVVAMWSIKNLCGVYHRTFVCRSDDHLTTHRPIFSSSLYVWRKRIIKTETVTSNRIILIII